MSLVTNWLESLNMDINVTKKCVRTRNRHSSCTYCLEKCKVHAITLKDQSPVIDSSRCTSCGECMMACPITAIEGLGRSRNFNEGLLIYNSHYTPSLKELLIYKKQGMKAIQAEDGELDENWKKTVAAANNLLVRLHEQPIEIVKAEKDVKLSRRDFFNTFQREGKKLAKSMSPASWKVNPNGWKLNAYFQDYQFYQVEIDQEKCTLCQACLTLCTEDVFHMNESALVIANQKCVNCPSCTDVCKERAIHIEWGLREKTETWIEMDTKTCKSCGRTYSSFKSEADLCPICRNRPPEWLSPYK